MKNCWVHPTHRLISTQSVADRIAARSLDLPVRASSPPPMNTTKLERPLKKPTMSEIVMMSTIEPGAPKPM